MKEVYKPRLDSLIVLINFLDEYEEFIENLEVFLSKARTDSQNMLRIVQQLSDGDSLFGKFKEKRFYEENKKTIDKICEHSNLMSFVFQNYNYYGKRRAREFYLDYFYNYFKSNSDKLPQILNLLERLKELGFSEIYFNENFDFAIEEHEIKINMSENKTVSYFDNIEIIPNYDSKTIKYKTTGSNYKMKFKPFNVSIYGDSIELNSLLFDIDRLPKKVSKEYTFDKIIELSKSKNEECYDIETIVSLNASLIDLNMQLDCISYIISRIDDTKTKEELIKVLFELKQNSHKLKNINSEYSNVVSQNTCITKEQLEKEKQLYLKRREYDIH